MTIQKNKKLLLAMFSVATITAISSGNLAYANHGIGTGTWNHADIDYRCMDSLSELNTESGTNPCSDFAEAVNVWNSISSSDLEFTQVASSEDMTIGSTDMLDNMWAVNRITLRGLQVVDSAIMFSVEYSWGDRAGSDWWKWWVKDYLSTAVHESGHSIVLDHDANSELMREGHGKSDIYRTPSAHDIEVVQGKY